MPINEIDQNAKPADPSVEELQAQLAKLRAAAAAAGASPAQDEPVDDGAPMPPASAYESEAGATASPAQPAGNGAAAPLTAAEITAQVAADAQASAAAPVRPVETRQPPAAVGAAAASGQQAHNLPASPTGTSVANIPSDMLELLKKDQGRGVNFKARDLIIPRLSLLQDGSGQVQERSPDYVAGARPGMIINTVTSEVFQSVYIIPVFYSRRFVAWYERDDKGNGGGLVRMNVPEAEYLTYEEKGIGTRVYKDDEGKVVEVVDTPEWAVLFSGDGQKWMPAACAMPSTKAKVAGKISTIISLQELDLGDGVKIVPPAYSNYFRLSQKIEGEGRNSYFVYAADHLGRVEDMDHYVRARKLHEQFSNDAVDVVPQDRQ